MRTIVALLVWTGLTLPAAAALAAQAPTASSDTQPPLVTLTSPAEGFTTLADRVTVIGTVKDSGSGVHHVTCSGQKVSVKNGAVRCVIRLLPGVNAAVILAVDAAGNSASAGVRVLREVPSGALTMFPDTLRIGLQHGSLSVRSEAGTAPKDVRWTTSDEHVVTLNTLGAEAEVCPEQPGTAIVTAMAGGHTATARVTVLDTHEPAAGTLQWSVSPVAGFASRPPIRTFQSSANSPDVFLVDADRGGKYSVVRGLYAGPGIPVWGGAVPGTPLGGDNSGGLLASVGPEHGRIIGRFDGLEGGPVWQFEARGDVQDGENGEDGTVYLIERVLEASTRSGRLNYDAIVAIDGRTGLAKARVRLPVSSTTLSSACGPGQRREQPSDIGPLFSYNNTIYMMVLEAHDSHLPSCKDGRPVAGRGMVESSRALRVVRLSPTGVEIVHTLWSWKDSWPEGATSPRPIEDAVPHHVAINPQGELIAFWNHVTTNPSGLVKELHITRIAGGVTNEVVRDGMRAGRDRPVRVLIDAYNAPQIYLSDGSSVEAIDLASGKSRWTLEATAEPFFAWIGGRAGVGPIVMCDSVRGELITVSAQGEVTSRVPTRLTRPQMIIQNNGILHGLDPASGAFVEIAFPGNNSSGWYGSIDVTPTYESVRKRLANLGVK